jgi:hypothetical protein
LPKDVHTTIVYILGLIACIGMLGSIMLLFAGKPTSDALTVTMGAAVGSLSSFLVKPPSDPAVATQSTTTTQSIPEPKAETVPAAHVAAPVAPAAPAIADHAAAP